MARLLCFLAVCLTAGCRDAKPQPAPTPAREIVGAAGRVTGATYTLDVEIGHPISQQPATSTNYTVEGNAAIKR